MLSWSLDPHRLKYKHLGNNNGKSSLPHVAAPYQPALAMPAMPVFPFRAHAPLCRSDAAVLGTSLIELGLLPRILAESFCSMHPDHDIGAGGLFRKIVLDVLL